MRKIIWSFWDGPKTDLVQKSYNSWKKYCSDWEINLLDLSSIKKYNIEKPKNFEVLTATKKSDFIRLSLLYNYGGLWIDSTIVLHENLDWVLKKMKDHPYFGFIYSKNKCHIESWFIGVKNKYDYSIGEWLKYFIQLLNNPNHKPDYFDVYKAYCELKQNNSKFKKIHNSIPFIEKKPWYNFLWPRTKGLTKFTSGWRKAYPYIKFPLIYLYIIIIILILYYA